MIVRIIRTVLIAAMLLLAVQAKCGKKKDTLDQLPQRTVPQADTTFDEPEAFDVDTSDDVTFRQADLEAELERLVRQNLKPVYFDFNSYSLTSEGVENLAVAASFLMEHANMRVLIEGHCDERGSSEYNMGLGENRARAVKDYLANYGVASLQVEITSWGKERPVVSGCMDESCHSQNRRAEFKVLAR